MEESPEKKRPTDFLLCVKCQRESDEKLSTPKDISSYEKFISGIETRASFGNQEYENLFQRIRQHTALELHVQQRGAQWHRSCYASTVSLEKHTRDETSPKTSKGKRGRPRKDDNKENLPSITDLKETHPGLETQQPRLEECVFCQGNDPRKKNERVFYTRTTNSNTSIKDTIDASDDTTWKMYLAGLQASGSERLAYHPSCKTEHWGKVIHNPQRRSMRATTQDCFRILAEVEFINELQEKIYSGEYISTSTAENMFVEKLKFHGVENIAVNRREMCALIVERIPNVIISERRTNLSSDKLTLNDT